MSKTPFLHYYFMMIENADLKSMFPMIAAGASTFLDEKYLWDVPQLHLLVIFNRAHVGYYSHRVLDMSCYFVSLYQVYH